MVKIADFVGFILLPFHFILFFFKKSLCFIISVRKAKNGHVFIS